MRSFGVFIAGAAVFTFALLFPMLEPAAEAVAAIAFVAAVAYGFAVHPRKDVFYIRTTTRMHDLDGNLMIDHDQLAVRIETARLWLLFIPTALSVGFLGVTSAKETLWRFSLVESFVHSQEAVEIAWGVFRIPVYLAGSDFGFGLLSGVYCEMRTLAVPDLIRSAVVESAFSL